MVSGTNAQNPEHTREESTMCTYLAVRVRAKATSPLRSKHHVLRKLLASTVALMLAGSAMALAGWRQCLRKPIHGNRTSGDRRRAGPSPARARGPRQAHFSIRHLRGRKFLDRQAENE